MTILNRLQRIAQPLKVISVQVLECTWLDQIIRKVTHTRTFSEDLRGRQKGIKKTKRAAHRIHVPANAGPTNGGPY